VLLPGAEEGKLLSLHRLWHARVRQRADAENRSRAPLWSAIAACAATRRSVVVGVDAPGKTNAINNPRVLTDSTLRWELTPLARLAAALAASGRLKQAATVAGRLSGSLQLLGRLPEARVVLDSVLVDPQAAQAAVGDSNFASLLNSLAMIQHAQGDLPEARASLEWAITIQQKNFASDHPYFATTYSNLAAIQQAQGDLPGARASLERAIAIQQKHFAPDHPDFATAYSNLAVIQRDQGDLPGARASLERAIAIDQKHSPRTTRPSQPHTPTSR